MEEKNNIELLESPKKKRNYKALKIFSLIVLLLIAVAGVGYSVYSWQQDNNLRSTIKDRDVQIHALDKKISSLESQPSSLLIQATLPNGKVASFPDTDSNRNILWWASGSSADELSSKYIFISDKLYQQYMAELDDTIKVTYCGTNNDLKALQSDLVFGLLNTDNKQITHPQNGNCLQAVASNDNADLTTRASAQKVLSEINNDMQAFIASVSIK
ncbi:MAG: hypothetical protein JWN26_201 [Candidatus Saccharibacteria bacterium]|nr:hypothetical protein [Candidatus Saccharibacteria bacterium]